MPSGSRRRRSPARSEKRETPEILHTIGRAALAYGLGKLANQAAGNSGSGSSDSKKRSKSKKGERSRSRNKDKDGDGSRGGEDGGDLHRHMAQLAAGALAFGVKQYMHHRHERKQKDKERERRHKRPATAQQDRGLLWGSGHDKPAVDGELSAALGSLSTEVGDASASIRRLARAKPSHRNCEVHSGLVDSADRIEASLSKLQSSVNNVRNLHPAVGSSSSSARELPPKDAAAPTPAPRRRPRRSPPEKSRHDRWEDRGRRSTRD